MIKYLFIVLLSMVSISAYGVDNDKLSRLKDLMVSGCSLGESVDIKMEGDGGISFFKKGLNGRIYLSKNNIPSIINKLSNDKSISNEATNIRGCMKRYMDKIFDYELQAPYREISLNKEIYKTEHNALIQDDRIGNKMLEYYDQLDANAIYRQDITKKTKKINSSKRKERCEEAVGINKGESFDVLNYNFIKKKYKDKKSLNIIELCNTSISISAKEHEYYYYLAIGYNMATDYKNAIKYLEIAARKGSLDAKRKLGIIYMTGSIATENQKKGKDFLINAAINGDLASQKILEIIN